MKTVSAAPDLSNFFPIKLDLKAVGLTPRQFFRFCRDNPDLRIELTAQKEIVIMPPGDPDTGAENAEIIWQLADWAKRDGTGIVFDSSALFKMPSGAKRAPDASWIPKSRWKSRKRDKKDPFGDEICPDFVLELWSPSDRLKMLQAKMQEYIENGARLGFLIYPLKRQVWVYRPNQQPQCFDGPSSVSGDPELPGFTLNLTEVWE